MAFVNRAERATGAPHKRTDQHVGPGSYKLRTDIANGKITYAPFSSTAERRSQPTKFSVPGPTEYNHKQSVNVKSTSVTQKSPTFASRVSRFQDTNKVMYETANAPGPGSYSSSLSWVKQQANPRKQKKAAQPKGVSWVKMSAAPSIPAQSQSFGYVQNANGELIAQKPQKAGFMGEKGDMVGVGHYNPYTSFGDGSRQKVDFGKSRVKRTQLGSKTELGPGQYNWTKPLRQPRKKQTSVFLSKTTRLAAESTKNVPGPGHYDGKSAFSQTEVPKEHQFFGSKSKRNGIISDATPTPGPGAFSQPVIQTKMHDRENKGGFSSKALRWGADKNVINIGPGQYAVNPNLSEELSKKVFGRNTSFGQTTKRFVQPKTTNKNNPGPGAYTQKKLKQPVRELSSFASGNSRFENFVSPEEAAPGPGEYDAGAPSLLKEPYRNSMAFQAETRDKIAKKTAPSSIKNTMVGPGCYDPKSVRRSTVNSTSTVFKSANPQTAVFAQPSAKNNVPGPGNYNPASSLLKRSYNITVGQGS